MPTPLRTDPGRRRRHIRAEDRAAARVRLDLELARIRRARLLVPALLLAIALLAWALVDEWWQHHDDARWPLVEGTVESIEKVERFFVSRPELTIRIDGSDERVRARLAVDGQGHFPSGRVTFHYGGDATREVRLVGETSPWWILGVMLGLGGALVLVVPLAERRVRRKLADLDEEGAADRAAIPPVLG